MTEAGLTQSSIQQLGENLKSLYGLTFLPSGFYLEEFLAIYIQGTCPCLSTMKYVFWVPVGNQ